MEPLGGSKFASLVVGWGTHCLFSPIKGTVFASNVIGLGNMWLYSLQDDNVSCLDICVEVPTKMLSRSNQFGLFWLRIYQNA
jgi:hypothetical protein